MCNYVYVCFRSLHMPISFFLCSISSRYYIFLSIRERLTPLPNNPPSLSYHYLIRSTFHNAQPSSTPPPSPSLNNLCKVSPPPNGPSPKHTQVYPYLSKIYLTILYKYHLSSSLTYYISHFHTKNTQY